MVKCSPKALPTLVPFPPQDSPWAELLSDSRIPVAREEVAAGARGAAGPGDTVDGTLVKFGGPGVGGVPFRRFGYGRGLRFVW